MNSSKQEILIHIFSGCHIGAEISLTPGTYIFGSDDACDFILADNTAAPHHFSLKFSCTEQTEETSAQTSEENLAPSVTITPLEGKLYADQKEIAEETRWDKEQLLSVQGVLLAWTDESTEILVQKCTPAMYAVQNTDKQTEEETAINTDNANETDSNQQETEQNDNNIVPDTAADETIKHPASGSAFKKYLGIALSCLAVLALAITFTPIENSELKDVKNIEKLLKDNGFSHIRTVISDKGIIWQGILENDRERAKLHNLAQSMHYPVYLDIMIKNDVVQTFKNIFAINKLYPTVIAENDGIFLGYYVKDPLYEQIAVNTMKEMLPRYEEIKPKLTVKTVYAEELAERLKEKSLQHGLADITPAYEEGQLAFSNAFKPKEKEQIRSVMEEINTEFGFAVPYRFLSAAIAQENRKIPKRQKAAAAAEQQQNGSFSVTGVNMGAIPFITLSNDEKVFIGGILPNGGILENISLHELTINQNGSITIYPLRGN